MKFKACWYAELTDSGQLADVGVLVCGGKPHQERVQFRSLPGYMGVEQRVQGELDAQRLRFDPWTLFEYYTASANGVTVECSQPIDVEAETHEAAADKLISSRLH